MTDRYDAPLTDSVNNFPIWRLIVHNPGIIDHSALKDVPEAEAPQLQAAVEDPPTVQDTPVAAADLSEPADVPQSVDQAEPLLVLLVLLIPKGCWFLLSL